MNEGEKNSRIWLKSFESSVLSRQQLCGSRRCPRILTSFVLVGRLWVCSRRNQRRSSGFLDALPALVWTPLQTDMKFTLGGSIVSISRFNRAEGNNEGFRKWYTDDTRGGDAVLNSCDLIGSRAATGGCVGDGGAALAAFLEHGCNQSAGWHTQQGTLPSNQTTFIQRAPNRSTSSCKKHKMLVETSPK